MKAIYSTGKETQVKRKRRRIGEPSIQVLRYMRSMSIMDKIRLENALNFKL